MLLSLRWRFLDRLAAGTGHMRIGNDFFSTPRGFRNLLAGNNIFLTELDDYGPYATWFVNHPLVAAVVGSWTALLPPWTAYAAFVTVSLAVLAASAWTLARAVRGGLPGALAAFAILVSLPTYLMLWNGQMHVLLVAAVSLLLAGLVGLGAGPGPASGSLRLVQAGVLLSLLSKPLVVLVLPALVAARETRRAVLPPILLYAAISLLFLLVPALNPGGYNAAHWLNLLHGTSATPPYSCVFPEEMILVENAEIYSLPALWQRTTGSPPNWLLLKLPLLAILSLSTAPLFIRSRHRRVTAVLVVAGLATLAHFLGYFMVWEYHYTTCLPLVPVLAWMIAREPGPRARVALWIALVSLLTIALPTPHGLAPSIPERYHAASTLWRVVPMLAAFLAMLAYGVGNWLKSADDPAADAAGSGPDSLAECCAAAGVLAVSCGCILLAAWSTVPPRMLRPPAAWTAEDWRMHRDDILARPSAVVSRERSAAAPPDDQRADIGEILRLVGVSLEERPAEAGRLEGRLQEMFLRREIDLLAAGLPADSGPLIKGRALLAVRLQDRRPAEAEAIARDCLDPATRVLGADDTVTIAMRTILATAAAERGDFAETERLATANVAIALRSRGPADPLTQQAALPLARAMAKTGRRVAAENLLLDLLSRGLIARGGPTAGSPPPDMRIIENALETMFAPADENATGSPAAP